MQPPEEVTFQLLREMTDDFSIERKLGEGSFGVVYRGVTYAGEDVAVKMLKPNCDNTGSKQFKNEIYNLSMLRHQNIVQVLGYCYEIEKKTMEFNGEIVLTEEPHRAICLEYLHNGSLHGHLSDEFGGLDWHTRFKIIKGTCEGLKYILHDLEEHCLCHLDLKPDNILLGKDMSPKIADFGLSMIFGKELKRTTQYPLGTRGYQPPEYIDTGEVSDKFDIFSLGVVMIMIVAGPEGYYKCGDMSSDEFINQVQKNWKHRLQAACNGSLLEMYCHQVETCIQIGLNCVEKGWQRRPDIVMITEKLNDIHIDNCMLPWSGCHKNISRTTKHNNQRRKESKDIIDQHHDIEWMTGLNCRKSEFVDAQETSSYVVKELILGRDEEKVKIVTSLLKVISKTIIVILPIHGIGGIGKTTLARLIYNDPKFKSYSLVWVDITQRFDLTQIRESIVSQLSREETCDDEKQMMPNCLTNLLSNKKILVVLDDLWENNQFQLDELKAMLYNKDSKIIVLVTTRSEDVADKICTNLQPHKILPLANEMCWDIIKQRSGFDARDDNEQLTGIGLEIAKKCGGVALAAQSLGFTLRSMNVEQWMKVKDSDIWNLTNDHVLASLELSYSYMAPCLKTCFTYCAIFPKGHKMVKDDLIYQWISLDFIKPTKLLSNMHLCEKYIVQLLGLSFFQYYSLSPKTVAACYEDVVVFTMHDLIHDLAVYASKQDNGESIIHFELVDDSTKLMQAFTQYPTNIRGLRFLESDKTSSHGGALSSSTKFKSVHVCGKIGIYDDDVFCNAKDLHVLDLSACSIRKLPKSIGCLKLLRYLNAPGVQQWVFPYRVMKLSKLTYLSLRGSSAILALPDSIGEMEGLLYLDLSGCSGIKKLPVSFGKLTKLVHLDFSNCSQVTSVSESLNSLTNLEYLDLSYCMNIGELSQNLGSLFKLRNLNISHSSYVHSHKYWSPNAEVLSNLTKLEFLNLSTKWRRRPMNIRNLHEALNRFTHLKYLNLSHLQREKCLSRREGPIAFGSLKNLVYLDLSWCRIGVLDMLGSLTKLQHLNLKGCSCFDAGSWLHLSKAIGNLTELHYLNLSCCIFGTREPHQPPDPAAFSVFLECIGNLLNLEHLDLSCNKNLMILPDSFRSLRKLHTLDLSDCTHLRDLPSFLNEMDRLKFVSLKGCSSLNKSKKDQLNKNVAVLPYFVVHSDSHDSRSNLFLINDVNPTDLVISRLENVKSVQEAQSIKLSRKDRMEKLKLNWTKDADRFVEDMEVLGELVPPTTLKELKIDGYNSVRFPEWFIGSSVFYLPNLVDISMSNFSKCNSLPPLGQLPNLKSLILERMNGISEINWDLCGSRPAFPRLERFKLCEMESLKLWYTTYPSGRDGVSEFMFPNLCRMEISECPSLRLKPCPHKVSGQWAIVGRSDGVISSWGEEGDGEGASHISVTSSASVLVPALFVKGCKVPMHQWRLLHHLSGLAALRIEECRDLSSSPEIIEALSSLRIVQLINKRVWGKLELPNWLGQLASLQNLSISCRRMKARHSGGFPHLNQLSLSLSEIQSMTALQKWLGSLVSLQRLKIERCTYLNYLPKSIGCLSSLKDLDMFACHSITCLPDSIGRLTSLNRLRIQGCGRLTSLPESIQHLTNLKLLDIYWCQELEEWCETEENKAKLAHIKEKIIGRPSFPIRNIKSDDDED